MQMAVDDSLAAETPMIFRTILQLYKASRGMACKKARGKIAKQCCLRANFTMTRCLCTNCTDCLKEGVGKSACRQAWCKGLHWHHARGSGLRPMRRTKVVSFVDTCHHGLRRLGQLQMANQSAQHRRIRKSTPSTLRRQRPPNQENTWSASRSMCRIRILQAR